MKRRSGVTRTWLAGSLLALTALLAATAAPAAAAAPPQAELVFHGDTAPPARIALTFDAGSDTGYAAAILDTLAAKGVKADFGLTGTWVDQNPSLVQRMVAEGHHLINHTYDHKSFTGVSTGAAPLTQAQRWDELDRADAAITAITGRSTKPWFRPPYGDTDPSVQTDAAADGYGTEVMWTVDSLGWNGLTTQQIIDRVLSKATPGGIVLFHVGSASHDADALASIIDGLRAGGYQIVPVPELLPWRPFPNARALATQQYLDWLARNPGQAEVDYWAGRLLGGTLTPAGLLSSFFASAEFQGTVPPIARLYVNDLLRLPDPAGLQYWAGQLRHGATLTAVADAMLGFPELEQRYGPMDNQEFVTSLYETTLGRDPDPGGLAYWTGRLDRGEITRGGVMGALSESAESRARNPNQIVVATVYASMLRRRPDPAGLAYWIGFLATHPVVDFVAPLYQSAEYRARFPV